MYVNNATTKLKKRPYLNKLIAELKTEFSNPRNVRTILDKWSAMIESIEAFEVIPIERNNFLFLWKFNKEILKSIINAPYIPINIPAVADTIHTPIAKIACPKVKELS